VADNCKAGCVAGFVERLLVFEIAVSAHSIKLPQGVFFFFARTAWKNAKTNATPQRRLDH
jgi:hypothetical protein